MSRSHHYAVAVEWKGNRGSGTSGYRDYGRELLLTADGKPPIPSSADRAFHGDPARWNPEELLLAALSECHLLSYLHAATRRGVVVVSYTDAARATMLTEPDGTGRVTEAVLRPTVTVAAASMAAAAAEAHADANRMCFIANSVAFPVRHEATTLSPEP
ncbi:OsmC family protein [Mycetocola reblochoni]|uniref:OsmC/Ohr family protein n=2 Tax=Mycetocola reblochoni TaxID=331618 RepID=A0A1R4JU53_9MICO|nr:OsmC family protein [Mycetocola reblochoni]RLP70373.1 OsmC family peroxiredoxin [Mycetocola reblochoni]SJN35492.1 OsmC/Ohr family protein [Mycetocola reblochoni REB411]